MKLLYAARIARFDLLRSINNLARNVTKWSCKDDVRLHHLICYVQSSKSKKMVGWVGDDLSNLTTLTYMQMLILPVVRIPYVPPLVLIW